jgi:hypothetical protein
VIPKVFDGVEFKSAWWQSFERQSRGLTQHGAEEIGCPLLIHECLRITGLRVATRQGTELALSASSIRD